jgi:hypothetical protein
VVSCCEHGNETLGSAKGREFLDHLNKCRILRKGSSQLLKLISLNMSQTQDGMVQCVATFSLNHTLQGPVYVLLS